MLTLVLSFSSRTVTSDSKGDSASASWHDVATHGVCLLFLHSLHFSLIDFAIISSFLRPPFVILHATLH